MKNEWRLILSITIITIIISFAMLNGVSVPINYGFGKLSAPLIIVMVISLLLGAILTIIASTGSVRHRNKELKSLREKVNNQEAETAEAIKRASKNYELRIQELESVIAQKDTLIQQIEAEKQTKNDFDFNEPV